MTVQNLAELIKGTVRTKKGNENKITCAYISDLLSWVMAKGQRGCAWITVQTHMNVIAVATLHEMACVIFPESIQPEPEPLKKADEEGIAVIVSELSAYEIAGIMISHGIPPTNE